MKGGERGQGRPDIRSHDIFNAHSSSYLTRAGQRLSSNNLEEIFYAAFELRCFVEARQNELLVAQKEYRRTLPPHWNLKKQNQELRRIFTEKRVQRVTLSDEVNFAVFHFVPIPDRLVKYIEQNNKFCHAQTKNLSLAEMNSIRQRIVSAFSLAEVCASGTLLAPVLARNSDGLLLEKATFAPDTTDAVGFNEMFFAGGRLPRIGISYLDFEAYQWLE